ncbi:ABC transporter permease [Mesorhizobium sp. B4-1-4]|uniref:ABC transporter permease n=1 Tax=Mesorhizobium sp. B4-1-4 TaxID=2589888 RepID=UPI0011289620|nr:ABC transporter permease subunit [Mesorhizobium sp. B4-1-4]UCI31877.1 ABC transporter permease subunit [Mesorhizobium sp. B4-1-4]UCI31951.1 ABC transporter permease subunit [Mesorhizobium sp. B4-1-4]
MFSKRNVDAGFAKLLKLLIALTAVFLALPVIMTIIMSFDSRDYLGPFPPPGLSTKWFSQFVNNGYLWSGFYTSLLLATATTAVATVIGALAALAISRMSAQWRDPVTTAFLSPLVLPGVIIGFALLMVFSTVNMVPTFLKLLAGHLIITIPFTIRMTLIGLTGISATLREAALTLGANERQAFFTVSLPLARNSIAAGAIFAFAFSMDDLTISLFLSDFNTYPFPVALVSLMRSNFDLTLAAAAVFLMGLTAVILFVFDRVLGLERAIGHGVYGA